MVDHHIRPKNLPYFGGPSPNCWPTTPGGPAKAAPDPGGQSHCSEATHLGSSVWWPKLLPPQCFLQSSGHAKCGPHAGGELWAVSLGWIDFLEQILSVCFCATKSRNNDFKWLTSILSIFFGCAFGWQKWRQNRSVSVFQDQELRSLHVFHGGQGLSPPKFRLDDGLSARQHRRRCDVWGGEGEVRGTHAESAADWKARCHSVWGHGWAVIFMIVTTFWTLEMERHVVFLFFGMFTTEYQSQVQPKFRSL